MTKKFIVISLFLHSFVCFAAKTAVGDAQTDNVTFDFSIGKTIYNSQDAVCWTVSGEDISGKDVAIQDFGLASTPMITSDGTSTASLTSYPQMTENAVETTYDTVSKKLTIAGSSANPLRGKKINFISLVGSFPTVVLDGYTSSRYIYTPQEIKFTKSAAESNSSIITKFDLGENNQAVQIAGLGSNLFYASAVNGAGVATFGTDVSNIGFLSWKSIGVDTGNKDEKGDPILKSYSYYLQEKEEAIDGTNALLKASSSDLVALGSNVAMYPYGSTMLLGFGGTAANSADTDCAVGVIGAVGTNQVINDKDEITTSSALEFVSVLPDDVAKSNMNTICSAKRNSSVSNRHISTTTTSTGLSYLVVSRDDFVGGVESIYAVPLVTRAASSTNNGKIAKFSSIKTAFGVNGNRAQGFDSVIDSAAEINIAGTADVLKRIQVGASAVPVAAGQYIDQMFAQGDSVFIVISSAYAAGQTPGIFKSQAVFDVEGRIVAWTPWQRFGGTDEKITFAMRHDASRILMYITEGVAASGVFDTIKQTVWSGEDNPAQEMITKISEQLPSSVGGVQGMFVFPQETSGLTTNKISLFVATGLDNVVIGQTGYADGGHFKPKTMIATDVVVLDTASGLDVGSIVAAELAVDGADNHWLFLGGNKGLSVLSVGATGIGWNGDLANVAALTAAGQSCRSLGEFSFVKKIAHDGIYLYVMTLDALYRIALDPDKFKSAGATALGEVEVVKAKDLNMYASLLDFIIDDELIILGTTSGMYTIDDSGRPAAPDLLTDITKVTVPSGLSSVSRFVTVSNDANSARKFKALSNLYVLTNDYGTEQARINRFNVEAGVVTPIEDRLLSGEDHSLVVFDYFKNNIAIDGGLGFATSYKVGTTAPVLKNLMFKLQAGTSSTQVLIPKKTYDIILSSLITANNLVGVVTDPASGASIIGGDFGTLMNA